MAAAWTCDEALFVGGYERSEPGAFRVSPDAVAYDPEQDCWRVLPRPPFAPRAGAVAVPTGTEVVVAGGYPAVRSDDIGAFSDAVAYHPGTERWRAVPGLPDGDEVDRPNMRSEPLEVLWAGDRLMAWRPWTSTTTTRVPGGGRRVAGRAGIDRYELAGGGDRWTLMADRDPPRGVRTPIWTGTEVLVPPTAPFGGGSGPILWVVHGARYDPATGRWRPVAPARADHGNAYAWTGAALVRWGSDVTVWDADTDVWSVVPVTPSDTHRDSVVVWTGDELLLVNARELYRLGG